MPENQVVTICDDKEGYRFGFNGQEKVNEIAGIGYHNTALFGEYDTRLALRWNRDPKPTYLSLVYLKSCTEFAA
ncbi:MAG: hypothetical protein EOP48_06355 [Sphingobacteriales bacterium]|nr:MAG: hypothetical protein EOP48_06355 [Sphingobacteriales bacterium]